jgi:hypothetical protein
MCAGDKSVNLTADLDLVPRLIISKYVPILPPVRPLFKSIHVYLLWHAYECFHSLFSPQDVTMFYIHFSIFKLQLDLQYGYARAQLTIKGLGVECR